MSSPGEYTAARLDLQRVSTHILARARFEADGRFGLRATPSGIGTPQFGPNATVLRIAGASLIREFSTDGESQSAALALAGTSMRELAEFAGADLTNPFSAGPDTPELGDVDAPLEFDRGAAGEVLSWLRVGATALDRVLVAAREPSMAQLWPEHFDIGLDIATDSGRVNLGASPGDAAHPEPYAYVGPWEAGRPGESTYWNEPFGASIGRAEGAAESAQIDAAADFFAKGLRQLGG